MELIERAPRMSTDRMYCPSTDEIIFAPGYDEIFDNAEAYIAMWDADLMGEPTINNESLETAWKKFYNEDLNEKRQAHDYIWDDFRDFLRNYDNPEWMVYECDFYGMACGPTTTTLVFVVKADTIIEEDPDYNAEEAEQELNNMTEEELTDKVLSSQINAMFGGMDKEK